MRMAELDGGRAAEAVTAAPGPVSRRIRGSVAVLLLSGAAVIAGVPVTPTTAAPPAAVADRDCLAELIEGRGAEIACTFPVRMTDAELEQVRKATRDLLRDARCAMTIRIERRLVTEAVAASDHVFQAPPQPVACDVITARGALAITFTFAPRVEFKGGEAVMASPMMADVAGVSRVLSWPVVTYVNHSSEIRQGMLQVVNAYLRHQRTKHARAGR